MWLQSTLAVMMMNDVVKHLMREITVAVNVCERNFLEYAMKWYWENTSKDVRSKQKDKKWHH
jgi:hypothetical protein